MLISVIDAVPGRGSAVEVGGLLSDRSSAGTRDEVFRRVYFDQFARLSAYCGWMLRDADAGRDCAQEAFVRLYAKWLGVDDPAAYVFVVGTNIVKDRLRKLSRNARLFASCDVTPRIPYPLPTWLSATPSAVCLEPCAIPCCCTTSATSRWMKWRGCSGVHPEP